MAHLKNLDAFTFNQAQFAALKSAQVGHNRMVTLTPEGELQCRLHGHKVASFKGGADGLEVTLDHCGWLTTTTMAAMSDFLAAMGVWGNVGRAKGVFTAFWMDWRDTTSKAYKEGYQAPTRHELTSPDNRRITFVVPFEALRK